MKLYSHVGPDNIGELLRRNRHVAGLTVREAAEQAGVSHATFSRVENGGNPSLTTYFKLRTWVAGPSPEGDSSCVH